MRTCAQRRVLRGGLSQADALRLPLCIRTYCAFSLGRKGSVENGKISMFDSVVRRGAYSQVAAAIMKLIAVSIFADIINSLNHDDRSNDAGRELKPGGAFTLAVSSPPPQLLLCTARPQMGAEEAHKPSLGSRKKKGVGLGEHGGCADRC